MDQVIADTVKLLNQGQINSHLTGGTADFPRRVHWCAVKELTKLNSFSATVIGYDLVISHTKL